jgi:hypothetical protein
MEGDPPLAAHASNWIIINTCGGLPTTSQASPSRTSRPRTRRPSSAPRTQRSHPSCPVPASRSPRRRANQAGRWSPIAAEHLLCTGSDPLELKPRPAHIRRFFARSPPECRPRSASGVVTQRSSQGGQGCPGEADGRASKLHAVRERAVSGQRAWWLTERVPRWALAGIRAKGPPHRSAGRRPGSTAARCRRRRGWPAAGHRD